MLHEIEARALEAHYGRSVATVGVSGRGNECMFNAVAANKAVQARVHGVNATTLKAIALVHATAFDYSGGIISAYAEEARGEGTPTRGGQSQWRDPGGRVRTRGDNPRCRNPTAYLAGIRLLAAGADMFEEAMGPVLANLLGVAIRIHAFHPTGVMLTTTYFPAGRGGSEAVPLVIIGLDVAGAHYFAVCFVMLATTGVERIRADAHVVVPRRLAGLC